MASNSFGTIFKFTTWGESHGPAIGCVIDGCPSLIDLSEADIQPFLDQRKPAQSRGAWIDRTRLVMWRKPLSHDASSR